MQALALIQVADVPEVEEVPEVQEVPEVSVIPEETKVPEATEEKEPSGNAVAGSVDEEVRCIKKVMQVGGRLQVRLTADGWFLRWKKQCGRRRSGVSIASQRSATTPTSPTMWPRR